MDESGNLAATEKIAADLSCALEAQKRHRDEFKSIFEERTELGKSVRDLKNQLREQMQAAGLSTVTLENGASVEVVGRQVVRHDADLIQSGFVDGKYEEYIDAVTANVESVKIVKKRRKSD